MCDEEITEPKVSKPIISEINDYWIGQYTSLSRRIRMRKVVPH